MRSRIDIPDELHKLSHHQGGVLTAAQLVDGGLSRRVIHRMSQQWQRLGNGLFALTAPTWESAAWAGILRGGEHAVLSGDAACYLHGFLRDEPSTLSVWTPTAHQSFTVGEWSVQIRRGDRSGIGTLTRARPAPALLDLANDADEDQTVAAIAAALSKGKTTASALLAELHSRKRTRHSKVIHELCTSAGKGIESALEWRFVKRVIEPHGLPRPTRQVRLSAGRVDDYFEEFNTIVELDGRRDHSDWSRDMFRDNAHSIRRGALTLRYGWNAVSFRACLVARQVAEGIESRGWFGTLDRCKNCANVQ